jgi:hypothetical protein
MILEYITFSKMFEKEVRTEMGGCGLETHVSK